MKNALSPKDYETLSAYLDGQLSPRERAKVESRIQTRPEWRTEFDELRSTRMLLRSLPKRRAPRNFTLSPAMVPTRPRPGQRAYPFFRLASAVASALLIIVFASDLALNLTAQTAGVPAASQPMPAAAPTQSTMADQPAASQLFATPTQSPLPTQRAGIAAAPSLPEATATESGNRIMNAAPQVPTEPAAAATAAPASAEPEPTSTPEPGFSAAAVPSPTGPPVGFGAGAPAETLPFQETPPVDETEHAIQAMTEAPPGMGGEVSPNQPPPEPSLKLAPETATPEPAAPLAAEQAPVQPTESLEALSQAAAPTTGEIVPGDAAQPEVSNQALETQSEAAREVTPAPSSRLPFNAGPALRLVEAILAGTAILAGLAAVWLRTRANP